MQPKTIWAYLGEAKRPVCEIVVDGTTTKDVNEIAEYFNTYFHSVFSQTVLGNVFHSTVFEAHEVDFISCNGIVSMLLNLKTTKSYGPDGILNMFFKRYAECISRFLLYCSELLCCLLRCPKTRGQLG